MNEQVRHQKFGQGTITETKDNHVIVLFDGMAETKIFIYPDAFESFLEFENTGLQEKAERDLVVEKEKKREEAEKKRQEYQKVEDERRREHLELLKKRRRTAVKTTKTKKAAAAKVVKK